MLPKLSSFFELTKPRLTAMVILTTALGYILAHPSFQWDIQFLQAILGSWMVASGAAALNEYWERDRDALMHRTQTRPLPERRLTAPEALVFGLTLSAAGAWGLWVWVNPLTSALSLVSLGSYLLAYTPLKTRTSLCTLVGAIPGAIPPVMGWTAARNSLDVGAATLFAILFLWQLPHFLAIAWMCRDDYARAGFPMLPVIDVEGSMTARMILLYTAALVPVTLIPTGLGLTGGGYFWAALVLGCAFFACGVLTAFHRTDASARRLLLASVVYLPTLLASMTLSRPV